MKSSKSPILVTVKFEGKVHKLTTFKDEYRSLMHLIFDTVFIHEFGECKGVGRCGTCLVEITNNPIIASQSERNEATTLSKMDNITSKSRLACQILIDEKINNLHCEIITTDALGY